MLFALLLSLPASAFAQATARDLAVVAEDGTEVRIGEVTGDIEVEPSPDGRSRFGRVSVRAGLVLDARATERSQIPVWPRGTVGPIVARGREARIDALRTEGTEVLARIVVGDAVLSDVPIAPGRWVVRGPPPVGHSVTWRPTRSSLAAGVTTLCVTPGAACVSLETPTPIPVRVLGRRGDWHHLRAVADDVTLEGWASHPALAPTEPLGSFWDPEPGAISGACRSEGTEAIVAAGTPVHLSVDGPVWARAPDAPTRMWVRDGGGPWIEIHFAEGVQRAWPATTCSLGWARREAVSR